MATKAGLDISLEVKGLMEAIAPFVDKYVGSDRIKRMRKAFSKAANRMKYYVKQEFAKHSKSGLLAGAVSYRVKYYRNTDTLVAVVGVRSKQEIMWKGRKQVSHKYAHFLRTGHKDFKQRLRQPPFHPKNPNAVGKRFSRMMGAEPPNLVNLQAVIDAHRVTILQAAIFGAAMEPK